MQFIDALSRLLEYSNPNSKFEDAFFCISNNELLLENKALIVKNDEGLCEVVLNFKRPDYSYMNTVKTSIMVPIRYLNDKTWHYTTTWTDLRKLHDAIT